MNLKQATAHILKSIERIENSVNDIETLKNAIDDIFTKYHFSFVSDEYLFLVYSLAKATQEVRRLQTCLKKEAALFDLSIKEGKTKEEINKKGCYETKANL